MYQQSTSGKEMVWHYPTSHWWDTGSWMCNLEQRRTTVSQGHDWLVFQSKGTCARKRYSFVTETLGHLFISRLILIFNMTPTPHPVQRCSIGRRMFIQVLHSIHIWLLQLQDRHPNAASFSSRSHSPYVNVIWQPPWVPLCWWIVDTHLLLIGWYSCICIPACVSY